MKRTLPNCWQLALKQGKGKKKLDQKVICKPVGEVIKKEWRRGKQQITRRTLMFSVQSQHLPIGEMLSCLQHWQHCASEHQQRSQFCSNIPSSEMQGRQQRTAKSDVPDQNVINHKELIQEERRSLWILLKWWWMVTQIFARHLISQRDL